MLWIIKYVKFNMISLLQCVLYSKTLVNTKPNHSVFIITTNIAVEKYKFLLLFCLHWRHQSCFSTFTGKCFVDCLCEGRMFQGIFDILWLYKLLQTIILVTAPFVTLQTIDYLNFQTSLPKYHPLTFQLLPVSRKPQSPLREDLNDVNRLR